MNVTISAVIDDVAVVGGQIGLEEGSIFNLNDFQPSIVIGATVQLDLVVDGFFKFLVFFYLSELRNSII